MSGETTSKSWYSLTCKGCGKSVAEVNEGFCRTCLPVEPCHPDDPRAIKWGAYISGAHTR